MLSAIMSLAGGRIRYKSLRLAHRLTQRGRSVSYSARM